MKNKSLLTKILLAILMFVGMVSRTNAVTVNSVDTTYKCDGSDCPIIGDYDLNIGGGEIFHMSDGNDAYCIDPGAPAPGAGAVYTVDNNALTDEQKKAFAHICAATTGSQTQRTTALKAYSSIHGISSGDIANKYKGLVDGANGTKWNSAKYGAFDIMGVVNDAKSASTAIGSSYTITNNGNNIQLDTTIPMKVSIGSGYELNINGSAVGGSSTNLNSGSYKIEVKSTSASCSGSVEVTFNYDDSYSGSSGVTVYKGSGTLQRLLACNDAPGGTCVKDASGDCVEKENITLTCAPTCSNPDVDFSDGFDSYGNAICDATGKTVVKVTETPNGVYATESEILCFENNEHKATNVIMGTANDYCQIYCAENYELTLPGPDKRNGDNEVFVNAGSYFTIDASSMKDVNKITCYGKMDYNKLKTDITTYRTNVITAYNKWSEQNAKVNPNVSTLTQSYTTDPSGNSIPDKCSGYQDYKYLTMGSNGNVTSSTKQTFIQFSGKCSSYAPSSFDTTKLNDLSNELNTQIATANQEITDIGKFWDACLAWDLTELVNLYKNDESCNADINFDYDDGSVDVLTNTKTDDHYEINSITNSTASATINVGVCDSNGLNCNQPSTYDTSKKYINKSVTFTTTYKFDNKMVIDYETGTITPVVGGVIPSCVAAGTCSSPIEGFPISLDTPQGIGTYKYSYSKIGHDFDAMTYGVCSTGRFDSIININKPSDYECYYDINNCEECLVTCGPSGCDFDFHLQDCDDGTCKVTCVGGGCIMNANDGFLATYRTISLNELRVAHNTRLISNEPAMLLAMASTKDYASKTNHTKSNWGTPKGSNTKTNIKGAGETIYEKDPEYSIKLTPGVISEIRKYNKKAETEGAKEGYLNDTLTCKNISGKDYGICISEFVHETSKWSFDINQVNNTKSGQVDGKTIYYTPYGSVDAFQGPAWK